MIETDFLKLSCPITGETVRAGINAAELFTPDDIEVFKPETQLWWSNIIREYALARAGSPTAEPREVLDTTLKVWAALHPVPHQ